LSELHKLRAGIADAIIAFGSVVLFLLSLFIFALCERENEQQKWMSIMLPKAKSSLKQATA